MAQNVEATVMTSIDGSSGRVMGDALPTATKQSTIEPRSSPKHEGPVVPLIGYRGRITGGVASRDHAGAAALYAYWDGQAPVSTFQILLGPAR